MAEWLRRLTRNQIPSGSVGSNPTDCEKSFLYFPQVYAVKCPPPQIIINPLHSKVTVQRKMVYVKVDRFARSRGKG